MTDLPFAFRGEVTAHFLGTLRYTVIFLPDGLPGLPPVAVAARLRASGTVAGVAFSGAWQPGGGRRYLMLGRRLLARTGLAVGDAAEVRFRLDDPESVPVPPPLRRELERDAALREAWEGMSAGKRRALAHMLDSARTRPTLEKRLATIVEALRDGVDLTRPAARR